MYFLRFLRPGIPTLLPLRHASPPSLSASASAASLAPARLILACYRHFIPNCAPGAFSDPSHRSNSYRVAMYYETMFWRRRM